jgi:hypothetical protein
VDWSKQVGNLSRASGFALILFGNVAAFAPTVSWAQAANAPANKAGEPQEKHSTLAPALRDNTSAARYFIEFRVATIGTYGHSYAVYGSSGGRQNFVDLHPMGGYAVMALGHLLPVPANTEWDPEVLKLPVASRYRKALSAEQYAKLLRAVRSAKANKSPYWNAVTNNCNHFIGGLAEAIGLRIPGSFQFSYTFVPALRDLNEGANQSQGVAHKGHAHPAPT